MTKSSSTPILDSLTGDKGYFIIKERRLNDDWLDNRKVSHYGLAASSINNQRTIANRKQLTMCADGYYNNGTIRAMVNKRTDFTFGNRVKYTVEPNEIYSFDTPEETTALETLMSSQEVKTLKQDCNRVAKIVQLHDKLCSLWINNLIFGRSIGGIERQKAKNFPYFGEPIGIKILNSMRIKDVQINELTGDFEGYYYDYGLSDKNNEFIPAIKLLPFWYHDSNVYENTQYQGMSALWPILGIAQSQNYINDEDIPEGTKTAWSPMAFIYVGDKNDISISKLEKQIKKSTQILHTAKDLRVDWLDVRPNFKDLADLSMSNMKRMSIDFGFPLFLLFEDTANFATANQVMRAYVAGVIERDRTQIRGILEKYWYDPILADHLNLKDLKEITRAKYKINAAFETISIETRKDIIEEGVQLKSLGVYDALDIAREIDAPPNVIEKLEMMQTALDDARTAEIEKTQVRNEKANQPPQIAPGFNQNQGENQYAKNTE